MATHLQICTKRNRLDGRTRRNQEMVIRCIAVESVVGDNETQSTTYTESKEKN